MELNSQPKVVIVVLNWNGWEDTVECLESLFQIYYDNFQVMVVDNGSTDGSIEKIKLWASGKTLVGSRYFKFNPSNKPIKFAEISSANSSIPDETAKLLLIRSEVNLGFAKGNNLGIKLALSDPSNKYLLVLNNDTVVKPDFLPQMIKGFLKYPEAGLCGPKIADYYSGKPWQWWPWPKRLNVYTMLMFFTPLKALFANPPIVDLYLPKNDDPQKVYGIPGCCMFFRNTALNDIGYYDETTFLGWEEYIVAEKLLKQGYSTYVVPESVIYHKIGQSTMKMDPVDKTIAFLKSERYFQDNYLKMPKYQRAIVGYVRILCYSILSLFNLSYRNNLKQLLSAILKGA